MMSGRYILILVAAIFAEVGLPYLCKADAGSAAPAVHAKTGEFYRTFTFRDHLSEPKEIASRFKVDEKELGEDYVLSERPYWIYVPSNYDPGTAYGIVVYLGYKDSQSTPPLWQAVADKTHLILITPVCHGAPSNPPFVPLWQMAGLALDAVHNLKRQYNIDKSRMYLMSVGPGSMQVALATSDVFSGFIVTIDPSWCEKMPLSDGKRLYPPAFAAPPDALFSAARHHGFYLIGDRPAESDTPPALRDIAMNQDGFTHVKDVQLSLKDDLHYPMFKAQWFEQDALPFLDAAAAAETKPGGAGAHGGG
jgi:hypothetical protein